MDRPRAHPQSPPGERSSRARSRSDRWQKQRGKTPSLAATRGQPHNSFRSSWLYKNKVMEPCFGPLTGVTATVHPDSSHLIIFARTRRRGLRDVAVAGAITVSDDALRRPLNRAVMGH